MQKVQNSSNQPICLMCGICCRLFLINLNKEEYFSGNYTTELRGNGLDDDFKKIEEYGLNLIKQKSDGSCVYLKKNKCSIHDSRPDVCRGFFCEGKEKKYASMREIIRKARSEKG